MKNFLRTSLLSISISIHLFAVQTVSGSTPEEDVLRPVRLWPRAGVLGGISINFHLGDLTTSCNCVFENGKGSGPLVGISYEHPIDARLSIVGALVYQDFSADFSKPESRLEATKSGEFVNVLFERTASITLAAVSVHALARWKTGVTGLHFSAGPTIGGTVSTHIGESQKLLTPGFVYTASNTDLSTFFNGDIPNRNSLRVALLASVGYDLPLGSNFFLTPEAGYQLPLTNISSTDDNWRASAFHLAVSLRAEL